MMVKMTLMTVMLRTEAQQGRPMTVLRATHGVKTVTPRFSRLRTTYVKDAMHRTRRDLNLRSKYCTHQVNTAMYYQVKTCFRIVDNTYTILNCFIFSCDSLFLLVIVQRFKPMVSNRKLVGLTWPSILLKVVPFMISRTKNLIYQLNMYVEHQDIDK